MEYKKGRTQNKQDVCSYGIKSKVNDMYQFKTIQTMAVVVLLKRSNQCLLAQNKPQTRVKGSFQVLLEI